MMNPKLKADWVENLRSSKFEQCPGVLHQKGTNRYCCLGVLLKSAGFPDDATAAATDYTEVYRLLDSNDKFNAGSREMDAVTYLWHANDGVLRESGNNVKPKKLNFNQIADWIEENIE